jgi:hypothetical protein
VEADAAPRDAAGGVGGVEEGPIEIGRGRLRTLADLEQEIQAKKVAELTRADQAQADLDVKDAQNRETLALQAAQIAENTKTLAAQGAEITTKESRLADLDASLAAHAAKVAGVTS